MNNLWKYEALLSKTDTTIEGFISLIELESAEEIEAKLKEKLQHPVELVSIEKVK